MAKMQASTDGNGKAAAASGRAPMSRIEDHEEKEARDLIDELCPKRPTACGYYILVKTHIRSEVVKTITGADGKETPLYAPQSVLTSDQYNSIAALVLDVGPDAYKGERYEDCGPWCKPGDWVLVPRHEGFNFSYRGIAMQLTPDDKVLGVIDDPNDVTPTHYKDLT